LPFGMFTVARTAFKDGPHHTPHTTGQEWGGPPRMGKPGVAGHRHPRDPPVPARPLPRSLGPCQFSFQLCDSPSKRRGAHKAASHRTTSMTSAMEGNGGGGPCRLDDIAAHKRGRGLEEMTHPRQLRRKPQFPSFQSGRMDGVEGIIQVHLPLQHYLFGLFWFFWVEIITCQVHVTAILNFE